jgi:hypothetical protein
MIYFGLIERADAASPWTFAAGDRAREVIDFERQDHRDHGAKASDLRVIKFDRIPSQKQLDSRMAEINVPAFRVGGSRRTYTETEAKARAQMIFERKGVFVSITHA